jgi:hypothetical protein
MLEDEMNHFSLIRFIQDFKELDGLVIKQSYNFFCTMQ